MTDQFQLQAMLDTAKAAVASANAGLQNAKDQLVTAQAEAKALTDSAYFSGVSLTDQFVLLGGVVLVQVLNPSTKNVYSGYLGDGTEIFSGSGSVAQAIYDVFLVILGASDPAGAKLTSSDNVTTLATAGLLGPLAKSIAHDIPLSIGRSQQALQAAQKLVQALTDALAAIT